MTNVTITLSNNDSDKISVIAEKNVRFVMAKSLTQTAQQAQSNIRKHIKQSFVIRRPNFEKSIKIRPATKQTLQASVYTMANFAILQQTGGKQVAQNGRLAVPHYEDLKQIKAKRGTNIPFSFKLLLGSGSEALAVRKDNGLQILYYIKNLAYMPKRLNMLEIGEDTVIQSIPRLFQDNLFNLTEK